MKIKQTPIVAGQPAAVPPVYFQSLTISGVKCFRDETNFSFADKEGRPVQWTVILGENGVGKTTVLQCLAGMSAMPRKHAEQGMKPVLLPLMIGTIFSRAELLNVIQRAAGEWLLECSATLACGEVLENPNRSDWTIRDDWRWRYRKSGASEPQINFRIGAPNEVAGLVCYGYGAGRKMAATSRTPEENSAANNDPIESLSRADSYLPNAEEWLLEIDHLAKTNHPLKQRASEQLTAINEMLTKVLPEISEIRVVVTDDRFGVGPIVRAQFKTPFGWVTVDQLSFGYQTMVSWLVDLTRRLYNRYPESKNPIAEPAIVLLDEIDLHLHPRWQQTVMDYLSERFVNTQFIVTAHSPLIIQSERAANVILLQRDGDKVIARQDLDEVKQWRVDQILTSDLFGLDRTRPPEVEKLYDDRSKLLGKAKLSAVQKRKLGVLNKQIESLPTAETPAMMEVEELLRSVAREHRAKRAGK